MEEHQFDVVIVGAGPIGGRAATLLAGEGLRVLMIEEHNEIGRPFQCAGLVTPSAMNAVGVHETVLEEVDGALIHGPSGTLVPVGTEGTLRTYVVCRKRFDQAVVQQGIEAGAHIWVNTVPTAVEVFPTHCQLQVKRNGTLHQIRTKLLIGADGAHSWTRRTFKMGHPKELMIGFQTEVVGYKGRDRWLEMYSGSEIAPGFFAWVIPSGFGTHRIGIWSTAKHLAGRSIESCYDDLLHHPLWKERFEDVKEVARYCGPVPSGMVKKPVKDRVILLGDAAGMAKPTTGGGIGPGFHQIQSILQPLTKAIQEDNLSQAHLRSITKKSWDAMKKEQDRARALRNLLVSDCTDDALDKHFANFSHPDTLQLINEIGDIEKPVPLGMALLKNVPAFRKLALRAGVKLLLS
ncbi:NAD(P)/FAD-dependent oxidoreductase [Candidatus Poseidonia alphae]|mgnify:FL=1|uniref:NAD(P)/FAD-dependent oxidoreductase n=1 Tax=Candidatus Poseidonia alphae TaxID=1915863 RepID=UPI0023270A13|nr:NAD(P)/FAD-dependent oxidoreductase [Candidatus Poseidonia alphae]